MKKLLLLFIFAFAYESSFCRGEHVADSLINLLKNASEDSGKVQLQIAICNEKWKYGEYAEAKKYADAALTLSEKIGFRNGVGDAYYQTGIVFWYLKDNEKALDYHRQALSIYQQTGNKNGISHAYNRIGHDYADLPDYPRALEYFQKALELDQLLDNQLGITRNLDLIGFIYMNLSDYPRALTHYFQSLKLAEALNSKREISAACHDIAVVYEKQNRLEEALKYARRGLSLALQVGEKHLLDEAYSGLEKIYVKMGNYKEAFNARLKYDELESVLRNADNAGKIRQMQMQYDFEKREALVKAEEASKAAIARKELQQQELIINGFIGGFTIVLVFAGVVFIQRNKIRRGKQRSDELLLNILPEEVAEELKAKGYADAKQFHDVTVMFTDFKDFTQISEKLTPAELVAEINTCFKAFDNIIGKYRIEKIKTIGDSYMCAGGLPIVNETHAVDIVKAALEIQLFMQQHLQQRKEQGRVIFEIRIGIHTGSVVAGIVGVKKFAYDIWGDTVNTASRMESSGEVGKVNISGATYEWVKNHFACSYRGKIHAKHKGEIDMYFVEHQL